MPPTGIAPPVCLRISDADPAFRHEMAVQLFKLRLEAMAPWGRHSEAEIGLARFREQPRIAAGQRRREKNIGRGVTLA